MKNLCFIFLFCSVFNVSKGQKLFSFEELRKMKKYKSLEEAFKNPNEVYVLLLHKQNLQQFPQEILQLKHLQYLSLAGNPIKEIPTNIVELTELQYLHLPFTEVDSIPDAILNMPNIKHISLIGTPLSKNHKKMEEFFETSFFGAYYAQYGEPFNRIRQIGIISALVFNPEQSFGELGVYWSKFNILFTGVSTGLEWNPRASTYKVGLFFNALLSFQLNFLLLDNHQEQTFALRPEIGFGIANASLTYGYNSFVPDDFEDMVQHTFTLRVAVPVFHKKKKWYKDRVTIR